jgi:hypothetical protein
MNTEELTDQQCVDLVYRTAPRLFRVLGATSRTFSLLQGANDALIDHPSASGIAVSVASQYRQVCAELIVVQLNALLDRERGVSFQTVHRSLKRKEVREILITDAAAKMPEARWYPDHCRKDLDAFLETYESMDWKDLHGRLKHFRDYAVAHIFEKRFQKSVTYGEVKGLIKDITRLGEGLAFLARPNGIGNDETIRMWSERTAKVWNAAFDNMPDDDNEKPPEE